MSDAEGIYKVAQAQAALGGKMSALRVLRRSVEDGLFCYPNFVNHPLLNSLRRAPELSRLMRRTEPRYERFKSRFFRDASEVRWPRRKSFLAQSFPCPSG